MIDADKAARIEEALAELLGVSVRDVRDYVAGNIGAGSGRRTGVKFVRGSHGGSFRRDPEGTDILPAGYQAPAA